MVSTELKFATIRSGVMNTSGLISGVRLLSRSGSVTAFAENRCVVTQRSVHEDVFRLERSGGVRRPVIPWLWTGLVFVAGLVLVVVGPATDQGGWALWVLMPTLFTALGAVMATRRPGHRLAWLLMIIGLFPLFDAATDARLGGEPSSPELLDYLSIYWDNIGMWITLIIPILLILFWFPTGRFISRRWTWAGWVAGMVGAIAVSVGLFSSEVGRFDGWTIDNPIGFLPFSGLEESGGIQVLLAAGLGFLLVGGFLALVARYRRARTTVRRQVRWVGFSLLLLVLVLIAMTTLDQWDNQLIVGLGYLSLTLVPVTITVAIIRLDPESPGGEPSVEPEQQDPRGTR